MFCFRNMGNTEKISNNKQNFCKQSLLYTHTVSAAPGTSFYFQKRLPDNHQQKVQEVTSPRRHKMSVDSLQRCPHSPPGPRPAPAGGPGGSRGRWAEAHRPPRSLRPQSMLQRRGLTAQQGLGVCGCRSCPQSSGAAGSHCVSPGSPHAMHGGQPCFVSLKLHHTHCLWMLSCFLWFSMPNVWITFVTFLLRYRGDCWSSRDPEAW